MPFCMPVALSRGRILRLIGLFLGVCSLAIGQDSSIPHNEVDPERIGWIILQSEHETPSTSPSGSNAPSGSNSPSYMIRSNFPSSRDFPSIMPSGSSAPSRVPSSLPSNLPSTQPALRSNLPSDLPSHVSSNLPSTYPSYLSLKPSNQPSSLPVTLPSEFPTKSPSQLPSYFPSTHPSRQPSYYPTWLPSSSPTKECHDHINYRSPVNGLTCADHVGTDCLAWRFVLGDNITALDELINLCPVACDIPCGYFAPQSTNLSFVISGVPNLLDVGTHDQLLEMTQKYLVDYVQTFRDGGIYVIDAIKLKSQQILSRRLRAQRELQSTKGPIQIQIVLSLIGFSVNIKSDQLKALLLDAIDSRGYTESLRESGTFFASAEASSAIIENTRVAETPRSDNVLSDRGSTATVVVSVLAGIVTIAFVVGMWILWTGTHYLDFLRRSARDEELDASEIAQKTTNSPQQSYLSSSQQSTPRGQLYYSSTNMLESLSRSDDGESTDSADVKVSPSPLSQYNMKSPTYLSAAVPPMYVFDSVDAQPSPKISKASVANSKISARQMALAVDTGDYSSTSPYPDIVCFTSPDAAEDSRNESPFHSNFQYYSDPGKDDRSRGEESSVSSMPTPSRGNNLDLVPLKRSASFSDVNGATPSASLGIRIRSAFPTPGKSFFSRNQTKMPSPKKKRSLQLRGLLTPRYGKDIGLASPGRYRSISPRRNKSDSDLPLDDLQVPQSFPEPDELLNEHSHVAKDRTHTRVRSVGSLNTNRTKPRSNLDKSIDHAMPVSFQERRQRQKDRATADRKNAKIVISSAPDSPAHLRYVFEAPANGRLGLTLMSSKNGQGCRVHAVKEYSPLYGMILRWDKIVMIDSVNTSKMDSRSVTKILTLRRQMRSGAIRITIERSAEQVDVPTLSAPIERVNRKKNVDRERANDDSFEPVELTHQSANASPDETTEEDEEDFPFLLKPALSPDAYF